MLIESIAKWGREVRPIWQNVTRIALPSLLLLALTFDQAMAADLGSWRQWAGSYRNGVSLLFLEESGQFVLEKRCFTGWSDVSLKSEFRGTARFVNDSISLDFNGSSTRSVFSCPMPEDQTTALSLRLAVAVVEDDRFLLDDDTLMEVVNEMNGAEAVSVTSNWLLKRYGTGEPLDPTRTVSGRAVLPAKFQKLLLPKPLVGRLIDVGEAASEQINIGGWRQGPVFATQYSARVTIDLGEADGAFKQMRLYVGSKKQVVVVDRVFADRSEAEMRWRTDEPKVGTLVTSTSLKK